MLGGVFEGVPILFRYILSLLIRYTLMVFSILTALVGLTTLIFFLNQAKVLNLKVLVDYTISSLGIFFGFLFPVLVFLVLYFTFLQLIKRKLTVVLYTLSVSPLSFLTFGSVLGLFFSIFHLIYLETIYPKAVYQNQISYWESKNKEIPKGVVKNFWFKNFDNSFIYFKLISLDEKKAVEGEIIKVDKNFNLQWFGHIPKAKFEVLGDSIKINAKNVDIFSFKGSRTVENFEVKFPYDKKLLKVKRAEYFTLFELFKLSFLSKRYGLNPIPYLWELEKRLLLVFLTFWITLFGILKFLKTIEVKKLYARAGILLLSLLLMYLFILLYQTLVDKISLNPLYGLFAVFPYLWRLVYRIKES